MSPVRAVPPEGRCGEAQRRFDLRCKKRYWIRKLRMENLASSMLINRAATTAKFTRREGEKGLRRTERRAAPGEADASAGIAVRTTAHHAGVDDGKGAHDDCAESL